MKTMISRQGGASAIEFALILPLLVLVLFGSVELSLLLYNKQVITNASREGARAGIVARSPRLTADDIADIAGTYCGSNLVTFGTSANPLSISVAGAGGAFGQDLSVTVTYDYDFLVLSNIGLGSIPLTSETVMKME
jgi:Flp pilus assembly protein TadG